MYTRQRTVAPTHYARLTSSTRRIARAVRQPPVTRSGSVGGAAASSAARMPTAYSRKYASRRRVDSRLPALCLFSAKLAGLADVSSKKMPLS